jgi:hypothetical protein
MTEQRPDPSEDSPRQRAEPVAAAEDAPDPVDQADPLEELDAGDGGTDSAGEPQTSPTD